MLSDEMGAAANIKSKTTRSLVQSALKSLQHATKAITSRQIEDSRGVALFCGCDATATQGASAQRLELVWPPKEIARLRYVCDKAFFLETLQAQLEEGDCFGFIVISGNGVTFATSQGCQQRVLRSNLFNLPTKTARGGQSANRYARIRF